jgi:DNA-binding transcriptional ArsR family regulator
VNAETPKAENAGPPVAKRRPRPEKKVEITDPKAIRALAHAARLEVISELYATQVSRTATELAAQTGLTPSAMSYHLRALQKWGIVVPAATAGDARERRWKAAGTDFTINSGGGVASPEFAVLDLELDAFRRRVNAYARSRDERRERGEPTEGPSSVVLASNLLYLTPDQRTELTDRLFSLLRDYELEDPDRVPAGAQRMATMWSMIPDDRGNVAAGSGGASDGPSGAPGGSGGGPS